MKRKLPILIVLMSLHTVAALAQELSDTTYYDKGKKYISTIVITGNSELRQEYSEEGLLTSYKTLSTQKKKKGGHSFQSTEVLLDPMGCVRFEICQSSTSPWGVVSYYTYHKNGVIKDVEKYMCLLTDTVKIQYRPKNGEVAWVETEVNKGFPENGPVDFYARPNGIPFGVWYTYDEQGQLAYSKKHARRTLNEPNINKKQ